MWQTSCRLLRLESVDMRSCVMIIFFINFPLFSVALTTWLCVQKWIISYTSHHFTPHGRYELNKLTSLPMCGFIAQLVEQRTGNAEVTGSNPVEALIFFRLLPSHCLNWKIYCDYQSSLSSITAVQKWIISYTSHHRCVSRELRP